MATNPWSHSNKEWAETLALAQSLGWAEPKKLTNHEVLDLKCPGDDPRCSKKIFSTGKGSETVARQMRKIIKRCPHTDYSSTINAVREHLKVAERLLKASSLTLSMECAENKAKELLELATDTMNEVEAMFDSYTEQSKELNNARNIFLVEGEGALASEGLSSKARSSLREARDELNKHRPTPNELLNDLYAQYQTLNERADVLDADIRSQK